MTIKEELKRNPELTYENGVYFHAGLPRNTNFEHIYLELRKKENRLYSDEVLSKLPFTAPDQTLRQEWLVRSISTKKLIAYLKNKGPGKRILELGCGNGWLSNRLTTDLSAEVLAMDVNEEELVQGARVFPVETLSFIYGDIFSTNLRKGQFDFIVLASSVQYFRNIQALINHLLRLLPHGGEIHLIDSPLYSSAKAVFEAKKRSVDHFTALGYHDMAQHYFHHTMKEISIFNCNVLESPHSLTSIIRRRILRAPHPVFPWIVIKAD